MEFQNRLYDLRKRSGLSQEELANLVGVTRQAVQKWEAGTSRPDMDNLTALARYFNVTLDWLITGREMEARGAAQGGPVVVENHYHYNCWHYEYRSKRTLFGLPLVHVNLAQRGLCVARGIIAIGNVSVGALSIGAFALGGVTRDVAVGSAAAADLLAIGQDAQAAVTLGLSDTREAIFQAIGQTGAPDWVRNVLMFCIGR